MPRLRVLPGSFGEHAQAPEIAGAAREALKKIEPYVRAGAYEAAMNELEETSERSSTKDG